MTLIKIGGTKEEKAAEKAHQKEVDKLRGETKGTKNRRDEDLFIEGPLDGYTCKHNPNSAPTAKDPKNNWGDYYIFDKIKKEKFGREIRGYHVYSSIHGFYPETDVTGARASIKGTRGPLFRKCYYYCGFLEEGLLVADGISPSEFKEILTMS